MQRCELSAECCVCSAALCPWDEMQEAYYRGEAEWDEALHEFRYPVSE